MERIGLSGGGSKVKDVWDVGNNNNLKYDKDYPYGYPWPPRYYTCSFCQREFKSAQALGGHMNIHRRDRARLRDQSPPPTTNNNDNNDPFCPNDFDQNSILNSNPNPNPNLDPNPYPNNPNPNPNPNNPSPNASPSSNLSSTNNNNNNSNIYAHQYSLVSLSLSSLPPPPLKNNGKNLGPTIMESSRDGLGKWKYMSSSFNHNHQGHGHEVRVLNNESSNKEFVRLDLELCLGESKQDLDLELRLGI